MLSADKMQKQLETLNSSFLSYEMKKKKKKHKATKLRLIHILNKWARDVFTGSDSTGFLIFSQIIPPKKLPKGHQGDG